MSDIQVRKRALLKAHNTLNHHPERIQDELFLTNAFFDPDDNVQRKYEMLRRVEREGWTVSVAAQAFGFSRSSFYRISRDFQQGGLRGLLPKKLGPKGAHKLKESVLNDLVCKMHRFVSQILFSFSKHGSGSWCIHGVLNGP